MANKKLRGNGTHMRNGGDEEGRHNARERNEGSQRTLQRLLTTRETETQTDTDQSVFKLMSYFHEIQMLQLSLKIFYRNSDTIVIFLIGNLCLASFGMRCRSIVEFPEVSFFKASITVVQYLKEKCFKQMRNGEIFTLTSNTVFGVKSMKSCFLKDLSKLVYT